LLDDAAVALLASLLERDSLPAADRSRIDELLGDVAAGKLEGLHPAVVERARAGKGRASAAPSLDGAPPVHPSRDGPDEVLRDLLSPGGIFTRPRNPKVVVSIRGRSPIVFDVFAAEAPRHAAAFIDLVRSGRLDGVPVTRLDPALGILIGPADGGAIAETVPEAPAAGRALPLETFPVSHLRGALLAAPHAPGAGRFLIALVPLPELEGRVTCFGNVVLGGEALERIEEGDIVETVRIFDGWSGSPLHDETHHRRVRSPR
ncbi:MAG TPA: peptidylprolyl isomerase, partial [Planctomycetota bacterium]|nr:peptidylprolyl isomerase [Planctomycetota bacterium]